MGLTWAYNSGAATPDAAFEQADQLFAACQKSGSNMLVTAWIYTPSKPGMPHNEEVVGRAIEKYGRDKWIIVDKIGACAVRGRVAGPGGGCAPHDNYSPRASTGNTTATTIASAGSC
jgi:aryl-alcohol dehydrogenase-like predicted oxidoreductase